MYLGQMEEERHGGSSFLDFRACTLIQPGLACWEGKRRCEKATHAADAGTGRNRFDATDTVAVYAIRIPTSGPHVL